MANSSPKTFGPDIVAIAASCFVGFWASQKPISPVSSFGYRLEANAVALSAFMIWLGVFASTGVWHKHLLIAGNEFYVRAIKATLLTFGIISVIAFIFEIDTVRQFSIVSLPTGLATVIAGRWYLRVRSATDPPTYQALVIGQNHSETGNSLSSESSVKIEVVATSDSGVLEEIVLQQRESLANLAVIGANHRLGESELRELLWTFEQNGIEVWFDAATSFVGRNRYVMLPLRRTTMVISDIRHLTNAQRVLKRFTDIVVSSVALVVLAPVILVATAAIRIGGGSILYGQQRVGVNGHLFRLWKLRTMSDGERPETPIGMSKSQVDPRITTVGRLLRRWSIDEIPQFVNVLKGDMSVVGPRPRLPEEVKPSNMMSRRLRAKPGITGLWQVSGRSLISLDEADALDVDYVDTWSFVGDAVIILRTIRVVLTGRGAF